MLLRVMNDFRLALLWIVVLAACAPLLQRIPNGSDHYFMIDVGETQIVLNNWGTLHATGYPHYVITGNLLTTAMRTMSIPAVLAPALVSLLWGLVALTLIYALGAHITGQRWAALVVTTAFALTRTVWIHNVIAEIYSFGLVILVALLAIALWQPPIRGRIYWLALLGGLGVAHHRALAMVAPALIVAVSPDFIANRRNLPRLLSFSLGLGLLGFVPYAYLIFRARAGAAWVYGEPGTWPGLWDQFIGTEANRFIGPPATLADFIANLVQITGIVTTDLTQVGAVVGLAGLFFGLRRYPRAAITLLLSAGVAYAFHVWFYTDVLSALILPVTLSLAMGWLFLVDAVLRVPVEVPRLRLVGLALVWVGLGTSLVARNAFFIADHINNPAGLETIALAQAAPPNSTMMLPWGPRYFALGFAKDITGELAHLSIVDHQGDYRASLNRGPLVTAEYVRYRYPIEWWQERVGAAVYTQAVGPGLVEIRTEPKISPGALPPIETITAQAALRCTEDQLQIHVDWRAPVSPLPDMSVFVHLLDASGALIAQADQFAPVYGWRPLSTWQPGEIIRDVYALPRANGEIIRLGLYIQRPDGGSENTVEYEMGVNCDA